MKKLLPLLAAGLFLFPAAALADLFTGTLEIRDGKPMLIRCNLGKHRYFWVDKNGNADAYLNTLQELGITPDSPFQAQVFGDAHWDGSIDTPLTLTVDSIENIVPGSCHLGAMF